MAVEAHVLSRGLSEATQLIKVHVPLSVQWVRWGGPFYERVVLCSNVRVGSDKHPAVSVSRLVAVDLVSFAGGGAGRIGAIRYAIVNLAPSPAICG